MWTRAFPLASLPPGGARLYKDGATQIAVFRLDALHAVDNRCPHEGYPLLQGAVKGCVLTCAWHNYKFDLRDGACLMGDEAVRAYPVRVVDGQVELDLSPAPPDWGSLEEALVDRQIGRIARDTARLVLAGVPAAQIAGFGARVDAARGRYGPSHALPVALDILQWPGETLPLVQALEIASEAVVRMPVRERPAPLAGGPDGILAAVEAEDAATAEGLLRGCVHLGREALEPHFFALCADHFLDFGHALIYQVKVFDLLDRIGWEHADLLLGAHLYGIVNGTREDVLPEWTVFRRHAPDYAELDARERAGTFAGEPTIEAVLRSSAPLDAILAALSEAAAERLLYFDVAIDARTDVQDDWLDVTHRLTFVNAVRTAVARWHDPQRWRLVLMAAHFVAGARALDGSRPPIGPPGDLAQAIARHDVPTALGSAAARLAEGRAGDVRAVLMDACMADVAVRGIVVAHQIKTLVAAFEEHAATGSATPVFAVVRLFASPVRERRVGRRVAEALRLLTEGRPPRRISS